MCYPFVVMTALHTISITELPYFVRFSTHKISKIIYSSYTRFSTLLSLTRVVEPASIGNGRCP